MTWGRLAFLGCAGKSQLFLAFVICPPYTPLESCILVENTSSSVLTDGKQVNVFLVNHGKPKDRFLT
jgi:hypothetical protein